MAITVVKRPGTFKVDNTPSKTAAVSNSGGDALFTDSSGSHGLTTGYAVYIYSQRTSYNGFWIVEVITAATFKIREYATASFQPCTATGDVTFYRTVGTADDYLERWNAVHLPIVYKLKSDKWPTNSVDTARSVSSFSNSNGYTRVNLSGDIKASGSADALEQVKISGTPLLDGIYRIISWSSDINFVIDLAYSASNVFTGGTLQYYYGNYHAKIKIYAGLPASHYWQSAKPYELVGTIEQAPDTSGIITVNINEFLKKKINAIENNLLLDQLPNNIDAFCFFYIAFAESYDDANQYGTNNLNVTEYVSAYTNDSIELVACNASIPFRSVNSGCMIPYTTSVDLPGSRHRQAQKWLTGFEQPTLFVGKYFDLSWIWSYDVVNSTLPTIRRRVYDSSGTLLNTFTDVVTNMGYGIYRYPIEQSLYLESTIVVDIQAGIYSSEALTINVNSDCSAQDFYVTWLNYLGGYDYWNFKAESVYGTDILDSRTQEKNIFTNWPDSFGEFADSITKQTLRRSKDNITLNSQQLSSIELDGLSGIVKSPLVQQMDSIYSKRTLILDASSFPKKQDNQKLLQVTVMAHFTDENPSQRL